MQGLQCKPSGGWISLLACSTYNVNHEKFDNLLDGHDNLASCHAQICTKKGEQIYVYVIFYIESFYYIAVNLLRKQSHIRWYAYLVK